MQRIKQDRVLSLTTTHTHVHPKEMWGGLSLILWGGVEWWRQTKQEKLTLTLEYKSNLWLVDKEEPLLSLWSWALSSQSYFPGPAVSTQLLLTHYLKSPVFPSVGRSQVSHCGVGTDADVMELTWWVQNWRQSLNWPDCNPWKAMWQQHEHMSRGIQIDILAFIAQEPEEKSFLFQGAGTV